MPGLLAVVMFVACALGAYAQPVSPAPRQFQELKLAGGGVLRYALVLPEGFDRARTWPVLIALPPGGQDESAASRTLAMYWEAEARRRGWVVIAPASPGAPLVDRVPAMVELLDALPAIVPPAGKPHLAGVSNGGIAAVRLASLHPDRFASLAVLPGVPERRADWDRARALATLPVFIRVGETDGPVWVKGSERLRDEIVAAGGVCDLEVVAKQGHVLKLDSGAIFDWMERSTATPGLAPRERDAARLAVEQELNDFHDAASKADKGRYLGHFAPRAVFLGTDATERWTIEEFRVFVAKYFDAGKGWTYTPAKRWVEVSNDGCTAWFDERLTNASYGECRGSGVLVRSGDRWLIAQYNLTVPVPNDLMDGVVKMIREAGEK